MRLEDLNGISTDPGNKLGSLEAVKANPVSPPRGPDQGDACDLPLPDLQPGEGGA